MSKLSARQLKEFTAHAEAIRSRVQEYWNQNRMPVQSAYVVNIKKAQIKVAERQLFDEFLYSHGYVVRQASAGGICYLFPPLAANNLDEDMLLSKIALLDRERRDRAALAKQRSRNRKLVNEKKRRKKLEATV